MISGKRFIYDVNQDFFQPGNFTLKKWNDKKQEYSYVSNPFYFNETNTTVPDLYNIVHTKALDVDIGK